MILKKALLDRVQKLIRSSMSRHLSTRNNLFKSTHAFLSNLAHRQTEKRNGGIFYKKDDIEAIEKFKKEPPNLRFH